jgi:glyceraldehyde-3-phosphate dehydrogenase/erythrose-4-phosphate dehydrogenase
MEDSLLALVDRHGLRAHARNSGVFFQSFSAASLQRLRALDSTLTLVQLLGARLPAAPLPLTMATIAGYQQQLEVVAINELAPVQSMAHLLKYDTSHGRFAVAVTSPDNHTLQVGADRIQVSSALAISALPWQQLQLDAVLDCTGVHGSRQHGQAYADVGVERVLFSQPGDADLDFTAIFGVNSEAITAEHRWVSNGSCTTNCTGAPTTPD